VDERLRGKLAPWLEFYRELGIEELYLRQPGSSSRGFQAQVVAPKASLRTSFESGKGGRASQVGASKDVARSTPAPRIVVPARPLNLFESPPAVRSERETLEEIREDLGDCHRCRLAQDRRTIVFGEGNPRAELVFVGEGPGADEDEQGRPFVGRAGKLLNRLIQFVGMKREDVYICNVVKCRPPGNRTPAPDEVETCSPFLFRQIQAIQPRLVCCLGAPATRTLLGLREGITRIRGQFYEFGNAKAFVTFHPAYVLRNPREEKILREDFETIRDFLKS